MSAIFCNILIIVLLLVITWLAYKYFELNEAVSPYQKRYNNLLKGIASMVDRLEGYDTDHSTEVANICEKIGVLAGLNLVQIQTLKTAAMLHDIGEILLPTEVVTPETQLDSDGLFIMKTHPLLGELHLKHHSDIQDEIPSIIRWHHERWDGLGYPDNLKGEEIPKSARILALADSISAMSHQRLYREHQYKDNEEILFELESQAGLQFDPELVKIWGNIVRKTQAENTAVEARMAAQELEKQLKNIENNSNFN
jgi:HD-GYP domain-containing protein (c-di-GMP phosphodiesterase class II)